ncbi:DNA recombination protein RmuC [Histidinibacterium aquaticum]|uniref:DNA recombination protein RmuC homolog n=1 Tax=Histidinibacterium aquaticum TaxID=2613962 RepID=A0A5J5GE09_9RHOB|nr:DNA recombination protein RmuC [Histidinibacterium aquaticum]KAA9006042.1 DNA recombination protein RmuC [Histidinibacterium aquaticum]
MIQIGDTTLNLSDPATLALVGGGAVALLLVLMLMATMRRAGASARVAEELARQLGGVNSRVQSLADGQQQLFGGLTSVSEAQAQSQTKTLHLMEQRLATVTEAMNQQLGATTRNTAQSLGELQQRLQVIDKAQANITKLSGDVLSLQDILSNKQTRGAFGEIQLHDIVHKALPSDSYTLQATLSNGKRADCLIHLPNPPGPIVVDSKFPLEPYEALRTASTEHEAKQALRDLKTALKAHIRAIAEKYIIEGETADGALMFLPSEAIYAELHANHGDIVREGFAARVWIVSPTTCMATLNTMRAVLKDARMREQAGAIRKALGQLHRDVEIVGERAAKLETHLRQAGEDVSGILTAAQRAGKRAHRLDNFDFEELAPESDESHVVPLSAPGR